MVVYRWMPIAGALGCAAMFLGGCDVQQTFGATCSTNPPIPHSDLGTVDMSVSVPAEVAAGSTFEVTINSIGVQAGPSEDPPDARAATYFVTGGATPSGKTTVGSVIEPAQWPVHVSLTATGQPGEKIEIGVVDAEQIIGPIPGGSLLHCSVGDGAGQVATVQITD